MTRTESLLTRVEATLDAQGHGSRKALALHLGVRPQRLNEWLHGVSNPSGEMTLALQAWVNEKRTPSNPHHP